MDYILVQHEGTDSWKGDWVDLHFNFGGPQRCPAVPKRWYLFGDDFEVVQCK